MDTDTSPGSQNAGLVESVLGGVEAQNAGLVESVPGGVEGPTRLRRGGQGGDGAAAEPGAASVDRSYLRLRGKGLASNRHIVFRRSHLPLSHGQSEPIAAPALYRP